MTYKEDEMTPEQLRRWRSLTFRVLGWYALVLGLISALLYFLVL